METIKKAFFSAIQQGDLEEVQRLIDEQRDLIFAQDENNNSPILAAAYAHHPKIAVFLAEKTVLLNIFEASAIGKLTQVIRLLAKGPDLVSARGADGCQPLELASYFGHIDVIDYLIKAGATINPSKNGGAEHIPLHAAMQNVQVEAAGLLVARGADVNMRNAKGQTPLHIAAQKGSAALTRLLLYNGADQKLEDANGKIPLEVAQETGDTATVDLLRQGITKRFRSARKKMPQL